MSTTFPRRRDPAAKKRRRLTALRHHRSPARRSIGPCERNARRAWAAAVRVRKAVQNAIVQAFRSEIRGLGAGPQDADLLIFARLAVAEHRLGESLARAKAQHFRDGRARIASLDVLSPGARQ
jgi:hypothetical protein